MKIHKVLDAVRCEDGSSSGSRLKIEESLRADFGWPSDHIGKRAASLPELLRGAEKRLDQLRFVTARHRIGLACAKIRNRASSLITTTDKKIQDYSIFPRLAISLLCTICRSHDTVLHDHNKSQSYQCAARSDCRRL